MDPIRLLARSELRQRRRPLVGITLTVALVIGTVLAVTAGARRTESVLDRFLGTTNASDTMVGFAWPALADNPHDVVELLDELRELDGVEVARAQSFVPIDAGTLYDFGVVTAYGTDAETDRGVLLEGRRPAAGEPHEVAVNEVAATELALGVGDSFTARTMSPATAASGFENGFDQGLFLDGPVVDLVVVGIVRETADLSPTGSENPIAIAGPAFHEAYPGASRFGATFYLQTDADRFDRTAAAAIVARRLPSRAEVFSGLIDSEVGSTRTAYDAIAVGLAIFAAVGAAVGLLVLTLVVVRHVQLARRDRAAAAALGASRREIVAATSLPLTAAVVPGVLLGTAAAWAVSGAFPYSVARRAETHPGPMFDPLVHVGVALLVLVGLLALVVGIVWRSVTREGDAPRHGQSRLTAARAWLSPSLADGCSTVLWGARRRATLRPWTAVAGAALGVGGIVAIAVFEQSRISATDDPSTFGVTWDLSPDVLSSDPMAVVEGLAADPRVDGVGGVFCGTPVIGGVPTQLCAFEIAAGSITPVITAGRAPASPAEIALGDETAHQLGVQPDDQIEMADLAGTSHRLSVVGIVVNPMFGDTPTPGAGAVMTTAGLEQIVGSIWEQPYSSLVVSIVDELDVAATAVELAQDHAIDLTPYAFAAPPEDLTQLGRMRPSLVGLAIFLGALGVIGLVQYLVLSARRRRHELAVLRALGFVRRQVCESAAAQAVTITAIGLVLGVPLGLVIGRWSWLWAVRDLGIDDDPLVPWRALVAVPTACLVGALLLSWFPAQRSLRISPSTALREE